MILHAGPLGSPWDGKPMKATETPYDCPAVADLPVDFVTDGFYADNDPTHSIVDPVKMKAYAESSGPVKRDGDQVVAAADAYRATGSLAAARCVIAHIEANARRHSLTGRMSSSQAYYVQGWVLGAEAIAYLKVRGSGAVSREQEAVILPWMKAVAAETCEFYDARERKDPASQNNHLYWAAVELAAVGIAADDRADFDWAMRAAREGIAAIRPDGTLPREMARGARALHYHLYAAAPLVMLAELGMPNGIDIYSERGGALRHLVQVSTDGLLDPSPFEKASGIKQEVRLPPTGEAIGWATPYNRRFPSPTIAKLLGECTNTAYMYLGGLPPG
ncbi:alginate lyase family protein [Edaphobacter aggregans]|uniref:alginate lyase family protein n=1 Tax=Edaphobacter aggregans TaxID=570835 RepID=UPI0014705CAC|nr:alginate lyase family protein [Edaphobacter aggregans]